MDYTAQFTIQPSEIEQRLAHISLHKSPGPDGLPNWFLHDFASIVCEPLAAIFNASITEGYFPPIWKSAEVVPAPKTHQPTSTATGTIDRVTSFKLLGLHIDSRLRNDLYCVEWDVKL